MQYSHKEKAFFALVVSSLILFAFVLLMTTNTITNVSAIEANGVRICWDSNCRNGVSSIDWGSLSPGSLKNIIIYIRNEVEEPTYLTLQTKNWNPSEAAQYLNLGWDYAGQQIDSGETLQITLTLSVSNYIEGISSFSFDIIITGSDSLLGDVNGDGVVDVMDFLIVGLAFASYPGHPRWNPDADIAEPWGLIDVMDVLVWVLDFGKTG